MIILKALILMIVVIVVTIFACILADTFLNKMHNKRIEKLNNKIAFLKDCRNADAKDYHAMYQRSLILEMRVNRLKKENAELKKALDKKEHVTYNYYINK